MPRTRQLPKTRGPSSNSSDVHARAIALIAACEAGQEYWENAMYLLCTKQVLPQTDIIRRLHKPNETALITMAKVIRNEFLNLRGEVNVKRDRLLHVARRLLDQLSISYNMPGMLHLTPFAITIGRNYREYAQYEFENLLVRRAMDCAWQKMEGDAQLRILRNIKRHILSNSQISQEEQDSIYDDVENASGWGHTPKFSWISAYVHFVIEQLRHNPALAILQTNDMLHNLVVELQQALQEKLFVKTIEILFDLKIIQPEVEHTDQLIRLQTPLQTPDMLDIINRVWIARVLVTEVKNIIVNEILAKRDNEIKKYVEGKYDTMRRSDALQFTSASMNAAVIVARATDAFLSKEEAATVRKVCRRNYFEYPKPKQSIKRQRGHSLLVNPWASLVCKPRT